MHGSLNSFELNQTASRSVQPVLHSTFV